MIRVLCLGFNLRIESLVIERLSPDIAAGFMKSVSISELRVLLLRDQSRGSFIASRCCFNLRIESLVIERLERSFVKRYRVSISELRVLLLRDGSQSDLRMGFNLRIESLVIERATIFMLLAIVGFNLRIESLVIERGGAFFQELVIVSISELRVLLLREGDNAGKDLAVSLFQSQN